MAVEEPRHRLVFLGAGGVGKSSVIHRFLKMPFLESYKPTVEDLHCKNYDINGSIVKVDILDTAGQLAFPAMRRLSISTAHALILVYSIDNSESFAEIKQLWEQIKEQRSRYEDIPCVIVGNKMDLEDRAVDLDDARDWAQSQGMESSFMVISAKDDIGISNIFEKLLDQAKIPEFRKLHPILRRRLSANSTKQMIKNEEEKISRSRSLIRRVSRSKIKVAEEMKADTCVLS